MSELQWFVFALCLYVAYKIGRWSERIDSEQLERARQAVDLFDSYDEATKSSSNKRKK